VSVYANNFPRLSCIWPRFSEEVYELLKGCLARRQSIKGFRMIP